MRQSFWDLRLPTILGIFITLIGIGLTSLLVTNGTNFIGRATPSESPTNIRITNITDTSFDISYTTQEAVVGSIAYGQNNSLSTIILDTRDKNNTQQDRITHYFSITKLEPQTTYQFSVASGTSTYDQDGKPFEVTTGPKLPTNSNITEDIKGTVITEEGQNVLDAVAYLTSEKTQTLSSIVTNGSYAFPIKNIRTKDLDAYASFSAGQKLQLLITTNDKQSNATILEENKDIPTMMLSQKYDFTLSQPDIQKASSPSASLEFPVLIAKEQVAKEASITTPAENQRFIDQQPTFRGTAAPSSDVTITIESDEQIKTIVKTNANGVWQYRPPSKLSPGEHTITIVTKDQFGILKTIKQTFVVFAQGSTVVEAATPSATPRLTNTPTPTKLPPTPTAHPTGGVTPEPTNTPVPTLLIPTPTPTTPVVLPTKSISPQPTLYPGNDIIATSGVLAIATSLAGILLFLAATSGML